MSPDLSLAELRSRTSHGVMNFNRPTSAGSVATQPISVLDEVVRKKGEPHGLLHQRAVDADSEGHALVEIAPGDTVRRHALRWRGMTAELVQVTSGTKIKLRFRASVHLLVAYEEGERRAGETTVEGLPQSTLRQFGRKLTFVPAGTEFCEQHDPRTPVRLMFIYFDQAELDANSDLDLADVVLQPRMFFEDATLWSTVLKLKRSVEGRMEDDRFYAKALGVVLLHELVRLNGGVRPVEAPARGGLAPWQQRVVAAYIDENLGEPIKLATLAQLARLSPYYFCRAFKKSFGMPPYRYLNSRRIQQAKTLLVKRGSTVTDTGLTLGFSETSSFSAAFRRETGFTPTEYRRAFG